MSIQPDLVLGEGRLADTGARWRLRLGHAGDIDAVHDLQAHVIASLPPQNRYFIVPKSAAHLLEYLNRVDSTAVCVLEVDGRHAGQLVLRPALTPYEIDRHIKAFDLCGHTLADRYIMVQGALVDPEYRGLHLLRLMLDVAATKLTHLFENASPYLLARIVPPNIPSWISFIKAGFRIAAAARDPDDERQVFYLYKDNETVSAVETTTSVPDFMACKALLKTGWQGTGYDRRARQIIFTK